MSPKKLSALAEELGLTTKQRRFAEALASDPERNQAKAAEKAGYGKPYKNTGSQAWASTDLQKYFRALTETAVALAERRTGRRVATLADALVTVTDIMDGRMGRFLDDEGNIRLDRVRKARAGVVKRYKVTEGMRRDPDDPTKWFNERKTEFELESPISAAKTLIDHYTGQPEKSAQVPPININILAFVKDPHVRDAIIGGVRSHSLENRPSGDGLDSRSDV